MEEPSLATEAVVLSLLTINFFCFSLGCQVDEDRHRISLGMKNSYFAENYDVQAPSKQKSDDENDHMVDTQLNMLPGSGSSGIQNMKMGSILFLLMWKQGPPFFP